ncbi:hypothetical protein ABPG75_006317 [Micractinium tetrahymenae]
MRRRSWAAAVSLLLAVAAGSAAGWGFSAPPAPRFAVVPAAAVREGRGHLDVLEAGASAEGFLDRMFGTNCFSAAVGELTADCRRMEQEAKTRLALRLTNCQLATQGGPTYPCSPRQSLQECTQALPDRGYALFVEFLTHADSMCLFIQNQNFERYTENMLNRLAEGAGYAQDQLAAAAKSSAALTKQTAELGRKAEATLGLLREHGELEQEALKVQKVARAEALAYFTSLDAKQQQGLELQDQALQKQEALEAGQAIVLRQLAEAQGHVAGLFDLVEGRAAQLAAAAQQQAEAQRALAGELGALADSSAGIRSAVDVVISYQQRSDSVLMRLLGKSYSFEDALCYALGALAALSTGLSPSIAKAKVPLLALLGGSLLAERLLVDWLHAWLAVGHDGEVVLSLPAWAWLPLGPAAAATSPAGPALWQFSFKWAVRRLAAALAVAVLCYCWLSYRDYERESFLLLRRLEEQHRQRHEEFLALMRRNKVELAALLGGEGAGQAASAGRGAEGAAGARPASRKGAAGEAEAGRAVAAQPASAAGRETGGQLVALGRQHGTLLSVLETWSEDEEEEVQHSKQGAAAGGAAKRQAGHPQPQRQAAAPAAVAAPTPAAREHAHTAVPAAAPASARRAAAQQAARTRKRSASEEVEVAPPGPVKRRAGRRRSSATEETAVSMDAAAGGSQLGKRTRLRSSDQQEAAALAAEARGGGAAPKRGRRG